MFFQKLSKYNSSGDMNDKPKSRTEAIRVLKIILYLSMIACLMITTLAARENSIFTTHENFPIHENFTLYKIYNSKMLLDEDYNLAVSFPEMLDNLNDHGIQAFWSYFSHTFFAANLDSDGDKIIDYDEKYFYKMDINKKDSDDDGLDDPEEIELGTDPVKADSDDDGLYDLEEIELETNPVNADSDGDGIGDYQEINEKMIDSMEAGIDPNPDPTTSSGQVKIIDHTLTRAISNDFSSPLSVDRTSTFCTDDYAVYAWLRLERSQHKINWKWHSPNGNLYFENDIREGEIPVHYSFIYVNGQKAARMPGNWSVYVYVDDTLYYRESFTVNRCD